MASSDHLRYRPLLTHAMDVLRDCSVQAERLYVRLAAGAHSTRIGVVLRPRDMTGECRMRPSEIDKAIMELVDVGLLRASVSGAVYLVGHCESACPKAADNRQSWRDEASRILTGNRMDLLPYVLDSIGSVSTSGSATGGGTGQPVGGPKKRERETKQKETSTPTESVADAPAKRAPRAKFQIPTPDETRAIFADLGCPQNRMAAIADRCHDYWQSAGWKRKSGPIVDWKATCKTWWGKAVDDDPRLAVRKEPDPPQDYGPEVLFDEDAYWKANPMPKAKGAR